LSSPSPSSQSRVACPAQPRRFDRATVRPSVESRQDDLDEVAWMAAIAARGDRAAFGQLFRRYAPKIKAHLVARGAAPGAADELTQEVMLIVWRKGGSLRRFSRERPGLALHDQPQFSLQQDAG
jgi:hypothetical protein